MSPLVIASRWLLVATVVAAGCGPDEKADAPKKGGRSNTAGGEKRAAPPPPPAPVVAGPKTPMQQSKDAILLEVRKRELANEDFVESDINRDPFRSYLATFASTGPVIGKQHKIVLQKFSIDELKLVAIVSGDDVPPRAMFLDPAGMGMTVVRGDHVSKADALVTRVAPDRVFFSIEEDAGSGKTRTVERVVELHAGEVQAQ